VIGLSVIEMDFGRKVGSATAKGRFKKVSHKLSDCGHVVRVIGTEIMRINLIAGMKNINLQIHCLLICTVT